MPTVNRRIADEIVAAHGRFESDPLVIRIVEYDNAFGNGKSYGLIYEGMEWDTYRPTEFVRNPRTYWQRAPLYCREPWHCNGSCQRDIACND